MTLDPNDPRLTAYALGELDQHEAKTLEAELDESPDGQRALAELRRTAELLQHALQSEPVPALSVAARAQIIDAATSATGNPAPAAADSHTPEKARPALTDPRSPAIRRTGWLRRYRTPLGLATIGILAALLLLPAVINVRQIGQRTVATSDTVATTMSQEKLAETVDQFNVLMDEQRYPEAEALARFAEQGAPNEPVVKQMLMQSKFVRRLAAGIPVDTAGEDGFVTALNNAEEVAIPFDSDAAPADAKLSEAEKNPVWNRPIVPRHTEQGSAAAGPYTPLPMQVADPVDADGDGTLLVTEPAGSHDQRKDKVNSAGQGGGQTQNAPVPGQQASPQDVKLQMQGKEVVEFYNKQNYPRPAESSVSQRESQIGRYAGAPARTYLNLAPKQLITRGRTTGDEDYDAPDSENMAQRPWGDVAQNGPPNKQDQGNGGANTFQFDASGKGQQQNGQQGQQVDHLRGERRLAVLEQQLAAAEASQRDAGGNAAIEASLRGSNRQDGYDLRIEKLKERIAQYKAQEPEHNTEAYDAITENAFQAVMQQPLSTFSIDVDTASYANVRRFLNQGSLPPRGAVRIEELINYFHYDYAGPQAKDVKYEPGSQYPSSASQDPFAVHADVAACPWSPEHRLVRIGLKGREIPVENRPATNLVFLLDVSGSMQDANKLPLVKEGMRMLVERLGENDRVAMVVYAGASGLVLPSTLGSHKDKILYALDQLEAGGSTNGASGIQLAYDTAAANLIKGGANRVILCTDGDFNVGITDQSELTDLITREAGRGVFLSVLGFGMGNLKDSTLEKLADKGNGNYAYIDNNAEARKVLVEELSGTLVTIAKDVKIQIEFNPARVQSYRLIGYENRMLAKEDFNNDKKDAGEIGAGHTVTALYEVVPAGAAGQGGAVDKLEYQTEPGPSEAAAKSNDLLTLKLRYKEPEGSESKLLKFPVEDRTQQIGAAGDDFEFAAAVASFGMLLRGSAHKGTANYASVIELAQAGQGADKEGYRREFIELVKKAQRLVSTGMVR